ncbi:nucleotidyl transferase AbiEii/AbiGii toxin family protein [Nocardia sp. NPDC005978]|uniref:nucleotidyl transferase AbiEii/AbiGii toxin family protein n=1 Tax=Nocardia sp. NPDC005978 TaxID=3156725 RepID=UPI0033B90972
MTVTPWDEFRYGPWSADLVVPGEPPSEEVRANKGLPGTLRPVPGDGVVQRPVFDPAMSGRAYGMRLSEPHFADAERSAGWLAARRAAIDHVLAALAGSEWAGQLMVRGSVLLAAWFGAAAREPGDVDFVVLDQGWAVDSDRTTSMFGDLAVRAAHASRAADSLVRLDAAGALDSEIWTYDRVPGRRLVLPWTSTAPGIPSGTVQLDFVFNETPPQAPAWTEIARVGTPGPAARLIAASPELSLAWKLLWIYTDRYPEGKDLYDAVLLAENCTLPPDLLNAVIGEVTLASVPNAVFEADWEEFAKDYPRLANDRDSMIWRLTVALAPTLTPGLGPALYDEIARFLARGISKQRKQFATKGNTVVQDLLDPTYPPTPYLLVMLREILGPAAHSLDDVADLVAARWREIGADVLRADPHTVASGLR